jgi:hypothetical protein
VTGLTANAANGADNNTKAEAQIALNDIKKPQKLSW